MGQWRKQTLPCLKPCIPPNRIDSARQNWMRTPANPKSYRSQPPPPNCEFVLHGPSPSPCSKPDQERDDNKVSTMKIEP
jgi:hypothetical protein